VPFVTFATSTSVSAAQNLSFPAVLRQDFGRSTRYIP
jgi:hypothetical protein